MSTTLPEITIEGRTDAQPITPSDLWCEGFMTGYNQPDGSATRPLMINDDLAGYFIAGFACGQDSYHQLKEEWEERFRNMPQVGPGQPIDHEAEELQKEYKEILEALLHEHMPHTEVEGEPGPTIVRPNIVILPPAD